MDLRNYRTVAQTKEVQAIQAMISVSPDRFLALVESLLDDGYLPTENIIVTKATGTDAPTHRRTENRAGGYRDALDAIIKDIGLQKIRFETIRNAKEDFAEPYGVPLPIEKAPSGASSTTGGGAGNGASNGSAGGTGQQGTGSGSGGTGNASSAGNSSGASSAGASAGTGKKTAAVSINDPKAVM